MHLSGRLMSSKELLQDLKWFTIWALSILYTTVSGPCMHRCHDVGYRRFFSLGRRKQIKKKKEFIPKGQTDSLLLSQIVVLCSVEWSSHLFRSQKLNSEIWGDFLSPLFGSRTEEILIPKESTHMTALRQTFVPFIDDLYCGCLVIMVRFIFSSFPSYFNLL